MSYWEAMSQANPIRFENEAGRVAGTRRLDLTKTFQSLVELKRYAKSIPGSKFVRNRRKQA